MKEGRSDYEQRRCACVWVWRGTQLFLSLYFKSVTTWANILKPATLHSTPPSSTLLSSTPLHSPPDQRMDSLKRKQWGKQLFRREINGGREVCCWFPGQSCMRWLSAGVTVEGNPVFLCVCLFVYFLSVWRVRARAGLKRTSGSNSKEGNQPKEEKREQ